MKTILFIAYFIINISYVSTVFQKNNVSIFSFANGPPPPSLPIVACNSHRQTFLQNFQFLQIFITVFLSSFSFFQESVERCNSVSSSYIRTRCVSIGTSRARLALMHIYIKTHSIKIARRRERIKRRKRTHQPRLHQF